MTCIISQIAVTHLNILFFPYGHLFSYLFLFSLVLCCFVLGVELGTRMIPESMGLHLLILLPLTYTLAAFQEDHNDLQVRFQIY